MIVLFILLAFILVGLSYLIHEAVIAHIRRRISSKILHNDQAMAQLIQMWKDSDDE